MKFLNFMEKRNDPFLIMTLSDIAQTLSKDPQLEVTFAFHSMYKPAAHTLTISHYWTRLNEPEKVGAMKSDVFLKAAGQAHYTDFKVVKNYEAAISALKWSAFPRQLFAMLEDFRLEEKLLQQRPGMIYSFEARRLLLKRRFRDAFKTAKAGDFALDMLFAGIYQQWVYRPLVFPESIAFIKPAVRKLLSDAAEAKTTQDIANLCLAFVSLLPSHYRDMTGSYFLIEAEETADIHSVSIEERKDAIDSSKKENGEDNKEDQEKETLPTWHEEDDEDEEGFLEFDLNEGQKMDLMGEGEREADSGDQAFASVEGSAQATEQQDYDEKETKETSQHQESSSSSSGRTGRVNRYAEAINIPAQPFSNDDKEMYLAYKKTTEPIERPLKRSIQKTIEQKKIAPRQSLQAGRLGKKLLSILTEENPRLFYKNNQESPLLDTAFSLLVDCSASMYNKMDQLKTGLVLFHETLYSLKIPHAVTGFYEDALSSHETFQPNYFHEVMPFEHSLLPNRGPAIMQLTPEDDNRDGFAIRTIGTKLKERQETRKVLLVFTDGEPSAHQYNDEGIVDTQESVIQMRREGVEVIGIFLANEEELQESEIETMHAIYGQQCLIIPSIHDIPATLYPLLKKLLLKQV